MQWCCLPHLYLSRLSDDGECFEINCWYGAALGTTACVSTSGSYKINSLYCVEFWSHFHFASSNPGLWWWWGVAPVADEDVIWLSGEVVTTVVLLVFSEPYIFTSIDHPASRRPQLTIFHGTSASIGSVPPVTVTIVRYRGWPHTPYTVYTLVGG